MYTVGSALYVVVVLYTEGKVELNEVLCVGVCDVVLCAKLLALLGEGTPLSFVGNGTMEDPMEHVLGLICGVVDRDMKFGDNESVEDGENVEIDDVTDIGMAAVGFVVISVGGLKISPLFFCLFGDCGGLRMFDFTSPRLDTSFSNVEDFQLLVSGKFAFVPVVEVIVVTAAAGVVCVGWG